MKLEGKKTVVLLGSLMLALSACGGGGSSDSGKSENAGGAAGEGSKTEVKADGAALAKQVSEQPAELTFYMTSNGITEERFMQQYGDQIKKKFPNYTIKYIMQQNSRTLQDLVATNQTVDVMISSIGLTPAFLLTYNLQNDISDLMKKNDYDDSKLEPTTLEIQRQLANGGIYGLPVNTTSTALFYNKDLFDKFGVAYPKDGMNWDDLYELAKTMSRTDGGVKYRGLTFAFQHMMFLNQYSAPHLDPKTNKALFMEDNFIRAFENMARFYRIPGNELPNNKFALSNQQDPFYKDKSVAMILTLSGAGKTFGDQVNWDVVQVPFLKDKPGVGPQNYPTYFYITNMSKNRDAAFQVLAYVTSEEFQEWQIKAGTPSILKDQSKIISQFGADEPIYKGKNIKSLLPAKFAEPTMKTKFQSIADTEILAALGEYAAGKDVNTALREAAERADKKIAAELGK